MNPFCRLISGCTACVFLLTAALFGGCGGDRGPPRVVVSGVVTYGGKPIAEGAIRFMPVDSSPVPMAGALIVDGRYKVDRNGGVPVGTHKIEIEAFRGIPDPNKPGSRLVSPRGRDEFEQYIPEKYNARTQLEITIQPGSRKITKNFDLTP